MLKGMNLERVDCQDRQETLLRESYTKGTTRYTMLVEGSIVGEYNKKVEQ